VLDLEENRAPLASLALWLGIFLADALLFEHLPGGSVTIAYYSILYGVTLVVLPLYLAGKWNLGEAGIYLGFGLIFWGLGDFACGAFSLGPVRGICFLLRQWYPASFLIVLRLFGGAILVVYLVLNDDVGSEPLALPRFGREEMGWAARAAIVISILLVVGLFAYRSISRASFEGDVVYVLSGDYRSIDQPELVFEGILMQGGGEARGSVLVREHLDNPNLPIGRVSGVSWDSAILSRYVGFEVEILGKLAEFAPEQDEQRYLLPGRIRLAGPA
jgi:hypothetical protein